MNQPWLRKVRLVIGPVKETDVLPGDPDQGALLTLDGDGTNNGFRIAFRISKYDSGVSMPSTFDIYNLNEAHRNALKTPGVRILAMVGWSNIKMKQLFYGGIQNSKTRRQGADLITTVYCLSGFTTMQEIEAVVNYEIEPNAILSGVLAIVAKNFKGVRVDPALIILKDKDGHDLTIGPRGYQIHGYLSSCLNALARVYGFSWTIVDGVFQAHIDGQPLPGDTVDINAENGFLIEAEPVLYNVFQVLGGITIRTLLLPDINPGRVINLTSVINPSLTGSYFPWSVTHTGDTHSDSWETLAESTFVSATHGFN